MGVPLRLVSLPDKTHFDCLLLQDLKHNGQGFRIKEGQEEWLQRFCSLLPEANPGVQGSFRYHGRRQRRSFVFLRYCRRLQLCRQIRLRWLCFSQRRWPEVLMVMTPSSRLSMPSKSTAKST